MIATAEISVICQGYIAPELTEKCLHSLKSVFPGAELILSTWEGTDVSGLEADKIVFSPDPGTLIADEVAGTANNVNRQIVSTKAGLRVAVRPYILKTRTDIVFHSDGFLNYFAKYDDRPSQYFQNRLLICDYYTRNPRVFRLCFHPSDWIVFGRAEDVRKYYDDLPLMTEEDAAWFRNRGKESAVFTNYICRYTPEQHIFLSFLRQYQKVECDCYYDRTPDLIEQTERALAECFVVLEYGKQLEIAFPKYDPNRYLEKHTLVSHGQWRALYERYCGKGSSIRWARYRTRALLVHMVAYARKTLIRLLDWLGIKETVKRVLRKGGRRRGSE